MPKPTGLLNDVNTKENDCRSVATAGIRIINKKTPAWNMRQKSNQSRSCTFWRQTAADDGNDVKLNFFRKVPSAPEKYETNSREL